MKAQFQLLDTKVAVDTMTTAERFSFHTNAIDWMLEMPNAQVEFDFGRTNWSNWSVLVGGRISMPVWHKLNPYYVWDNKEAHVELRNYWRSRNSRLSTVYYWGVRGAAGSYDVKLKKQGNKGNFLFGGFSLGMIKQLYGYPGGNSVDLELGITAGGAFASNTKYHRNTNGSYVNDASNGRRVVTDPVINEIRAGLIYRFGKFPISRKYRPRYNTDMQYHNAFDDYVARLRQQQIDKHNADSLFRMSYDYFSQQYDSIYKVKAAEEKEMQRVLKEESRREMLEKKAAEVEMKRKQAEAKQMEKASKKEEQRLAAEALKAENTAKKEALRKEKEDEKLAAKERENAEKESKAAAKQSEKDRKDAEKAAKKEKKQENSK